MIMIAGLLYQQQQERKTVYAALIAHTPAQFVAVKEALSVQKQPEPVEDTSHLEPIGYF